MWTQHCVCEWLRSIDLAEFTPNLMCAGIHGALIVLESLFTAESLAAVLRIPAQKTLLRRHLSTHFNQLLGSEIVAAKREILLDPLLQPLDATIKVKVIALVLNFFATSKQTAMHRADFARRGRVPVPTRPRGVHKSKSVSGRRFLPFYTNFTLFYLTLWGSLYFYQNPEWFILIAWDGLQSVKVDTISNMLFIFRHYARDFRWDDAGLEWAKKSMLIQKS